MFWPSEPARSILRLVIIIFKDKGYAPHIIHGQKKGQVDISALRWGKFICRNLSIVAISLCVLASIYTVLFTKE